MQTKETLIRKAIICGHENSSISKNSTFHFHEHYELLLFISGNTSVFVNETSYNPMRGDLFFFNSTDLHKTLNHTDAPFERYCIHFSPTIVSAFCTEQTDLLLCFHSKQKKCIHLSDKELDSLCLKIEKLISIQHQQGYGYDILFKCTLFELIVKINTLFQNRSVAPSQINNSFITDLLLYIDEHIQEKLTLDLLAKNYSLNKNYLCKIFKFSTGNTIWEYIVAKRISLSKRFLMQGYTVLDACMLSGFDNYAHFSRTFKHHVGMTAREYQHSVTSMQ